MTTILRTKSYKQISPLIRSLFDVYQQVPITSTVTWYNANWIGVLKRLHRRFNHIVSERIVTFVNETQPARADVSACRYFFFLFFRMGCVSIRWGVVLGAPVESAGRWIWITCYNTHFWNVVSCNMVAICQRFGRNSAFIVTVKLVTFYQTAFFIVNLTSISHL